MRRGQTTLVTSIFTIIFLSLVIILGIISVVSIGDTLESSSISHNDYFFGDNGTIFSFSDTNDQWGSAISDSSIWLDFDGNNDYITGTTPLLGPISNESSYSFWIRREANDEGGIIADVYNSNVAVVIKVNSTGYIFGYAEEQGYIWHSNYSIPLNNWTHVVVLVNRYVANSRNITEIYINGTETLDQTGSAFDYVAISDGLDVGRVQDSPTGSWVYTYFDGDLDELRIYRHRLSSNDIDSIYSSGRERNHSLLSSNLTGWYSLNENGLSVSYDTGTASRNLTHAVAPTWQDSGATTILTENLDYTQNSTDFTIINDDYTYKNITIEYSEDIENELRGDINQTANGLGSFSSQLTLIVLAIVIGVVITLIFTNPSIKR